MKGERYLIVLGAAGIGASQLLRIRAAIDEAGLRCLIDRLDLICATDSAQVQPIGAPGDGVIIGDIFSTDMTARGPAELCVDDGRNAARSGGVTLIDEYWGSYVAMIAAQGEGPSCIVRAPLGRLPLYYLREGALLYAASDVDLLFRASAHRPTINWGMIGHHLKADQLRRPETALAGVTELLPGFRLTPDGRAELLWDPSRYYSHQRDDDYRELPAQIRKVTDFCVGSWARRYDRIVLGVSGGLDSSIIAASAHAQGAHLSCLTLATSDPAGDERDYAKALTDHLGIHLYEFHEDPAEIDLHWSASAHLPRPVARSFGQTGDRRNLEVARVEAANAFFSGAGGDNVFCYLRSVAPLADRLLADGLGRASWCTALDIAALTGASVWEVGRRGVARARRRGATYRWPIDTTFLAPAGDASAGVSHPWLEASAHLPPGKHSHIALLLAIQNHLDGYGRDKELPCIAPLLSQPLVELCLSVPSWVWLQGGLNRAPVRQAYADALPSSILMRHSKGTPDPFVIEIFERHRATVRDMLLGGLLAGQGLLDTSRIEQATQDDRPVRDLAYFRLLKLVDVEAWLRSWSA